MVFPTDSQLVRHRTSFCTGPATAPVQAAAADDDHGGGQHGPATTRSIACVKLTSSLRSVLAPRGATYAPPNVPAAADAWCICAESEAGSAAPTHRTHRSTPQPLPRAAPAGLRTRVAMEAAPAQCALISLSGDDPLRVAQVLKKAWMEGGVKRGLKGSVLVGAPATPV